MRHEQWRQAISSVANTSHHISADELTRTVAELAAEHRGFAQLVRIGTSRAGRPIEMLTVGRGPRSALVVGGSHGNEPVSVTTAEALARLLCANPDLVHQLGYTWHIVGSIDPDALEMNSGWAEADPDLRSYLRGFFRPAFSDQAEYTFPLKAGAYVWDRPSPENLAWQRAFSLARPHLHYSVHGADYGGIFFLTSAREDPLTRELATLAAEWVIPPNPIGEPFLETASYAPTMFLHPDVGRMAATSAEAGSQLWTAGQSSVGIASQLGVFSLTVEVPIWTDGRVTDSLPSGRSQRDVVAEAAVWALEVDQLTRSLPPLPKGIEPAVQRLNLAAAEDLRRIGLQRSALEAMLRSESVPSAELSTSEYVLQAVPLRILSLRSVGLLARAHGGGATKAGNELLAYIDRALCSPPVDVPLQPIPLRRTVGAQLHAALAAAAALKVN